jgi:hypothetical protein
VILGIGLLLANRVSAQSSQDTITVNNAVNSAIQEGRRASTAASQDVLSNYLQVVAKNLTSDKSGFQLKLNWFALNPMDSTLKYQNKNFIKSAWQRNGEFNFSGGLDKSNKFNSFTAGLTYNFLNRRDISMHSYKEAYYSYFSEEGHIINDVTTYLKPIVAATIEHKMDSLMNKMLIAGQQVSDLKTVINNDFPGVLPGQSSDNAQVKRLQDQLNADIADNKLSRSTLSTALLTKIREFSEYEAVEAIGGPLNAYISSLGQKPLNFPKFIASKQVDDVIKYIDDKVKNNAILHGSLEANTLIEVNKKVQDKYEQLIKYVSRQPLLTFGYLYTYGTGTTLSSHVGGFTYLQGIGSVNATKTGQFKASLTDTLSGNDPTGKIRNFGRNIVAFQAGYNQVLAMQKKVSVMEINAALEEDWATNGYVSKTDKTKFYFDAYFRARLPATPWLKLNLKWAPGGNVLGLIDFTYNFDK